MMNSFVPSSNNRAPIRVCSDVRCKTPLTVGKGNLCPNCVARIRSPSVFSNGRVQTSPQGVLPSPYPPASVAMHVDANIGMQAMNSAIIPHEAKKMSTTPSHTGNMGSAPSAFSPGLQMQGSVAIPRYRPGVMYVPNRSASEGVPTIQHFNERGELVVNHRRICPTVIDLRDPQPQMPMQEGPHSRLRRGEWGCRQCCTSFFSTDPRDLCPGCQHRENTAPVKKVIKPAISNGVDMEVAEIKPLVQGDTAPKSLSHIDSDLQGKSTDDVMMDDVELVYPEQIECGDSSVGGGFVDADVQMRELFNIKDTPDSGKFPLREKITSSFHSPSNLREEASNAASVHDQPRKDISIRIVPSVLKDPPRGRNQSLKLCSSENCTGTISANSLAGRCLQCVKNDWTYLKDMRNVDCDDLIQASVSQRPGERWLNSGSKVVKRKGVTWADQVDDDTEWQSVSGKPSLVVKIPKKKLQLPLPPLFSSSPLKRQKLVSEPPSKESSPTLPFGHSSNRPSRQDPAFSPEESPAKTPEKPPRVRLLLSKPKEHSPSSETSAQPVQTLSPLRPRASQSTMNAFSGWESDLTELSDTTDDASTSDTESSSDLSESCELGSPDPPLDLPQVKAPQSSPSSGLKIRIPPRPGGVHVPKCASSRCNNTLALGYKWKSCVLCRAQNREYQRRRHNVQVGHMRLDQELEEAGISFLAADASNRDSSSENMTLVPGARLCSVRDCAYIVPPEDEYQWKMCALCRLRRREQKKPQTEPLKNKKAKHADMMLKLTSPTFTCSRSRKGRCQSLDCGVVLTPPNAAQCQQCTTRRLRLMKRCGHYPSLLQPSRHSNEPINPSPYPQFKSFSTFLLEFKQRLTGFLHTQSVFFLFNYSKRINSVFALDGEYSICSMNFDLLARRVQIEEESLKLKRAIEHVGRLKFSPTSLVSELDGGGIAIRFNCIYPVPILQTQNHRETQALAKPEPPSLRTVTKHMKCELEITNLPDHSHRFIPGQRTIIRFRLLG